MWILLAHIGESDQWGTAVYNSLITKKGTVVRSFQRKWGEERKRPLHTQKCRLQFLCGQLILLLFDDVQAVSENLQTKTMLSIYVMYLNAPYDVVLPSWCPEAEWLHRPRVCWRRRKLSSPPLTSRSSHPPISSSLPLAHCQGEAESPRDPEPSLPLWRWATGTGN